MKQPCPNPFCCEGRVATAAAAVRPHQATARRCPTCHGRCTVDETDEDLRAVGIILADATDEDFRSSPFLVG